MTSTTFTETRLTTSTTITGTSTRITVAAQFNRVEAYERDLRLFGDQYSNFNAGKILLYLEGLAGISYSVPGRTLRIDPALPKAWEWMEVRLPVDGTWTRVRYTHDGVDVSGSPFPVVRQQELEGKVAR